MKTILIIDDESSVRKFLKILLEKNGYTILEAENGKEGIALFKDQSADLIITDLIMPEKEGLETIRGLKQLSPDLPIIAISGGGMVNPATYLKLAIKLGAVNAFSKPVNNTDLLTEIKKHIG